jgi:hypothetical protein
MSKDIQVIDYIGSMFEFLPQQLAIIPKNQIIVLNEAQNSAWHRQASAGKSITYVRSLRLLLRQTNTDLAQQKF